MVIIVFCRIRLGGPKFGEHLISSKVVIIVFYSGKIKLRGPKFGKPFKLGSNHNFFVGYELRVRNSEGIFS